MVDKKRQKITLNLLKCMERVRNSRVGAGGVNITEVKNIDDTYMSTPPP